MPVSHFPVLVRQRYPEVMYMILLKMSPELCYRWSDPDLWIGRIFSVHTRTIRGPYPASDRFRHSNTMDGTVHYCVPDVFLRSWLIRNFEMIRQVRIQLQNHARMISVVSPFATYQVLHFRSVFFWMKLGDSASSFVPRISTNENYYLFMNEMVGSSCRLEATSSELGCFDLHTSEMMWQLGTLLDLRTEFNTHFSFSTC